MNLANFSRQQLITLTVNDHCRRAAMLMTEFHIRHLPVLDQDVPVGMLSERNLLKAIGWWGNNPKHAEVPITDWAQDLSVTDVMSTPLVCLSPEATTDKAARLMLDKKIGAVAIMGDGRLEGMVTVTDFLHIFRREAKWARQKVGGTMTAHVVQVPPEEAIRSAWSLMRNKMIRHLIVTKGDLIKGMLSGRDLLAGITWDSAGLDGIPDQVRHVMTAQVATIEIEASLADAAECMLNRKIGGLPVTDHGHLVGIITESDLLQALVKEG